MTSKSKILIKRIILSICAFMLLAIAFTIYANLKVENAGKSRIYSSVDSIPHNKVALLLGTNPLNRWGAVSYTHIRAHETKANRELPGWR